MIASLTKNLSGLQNQFLLCEQGMSAAKVDTVVEDYLANLSLPLPEGLGVST